LPGRVKERWGQSGGDWSLKQSGGQGVNGHQLVEGKKRAVPDTHARDLKIEVGNPGDLGDGGQTQKKWLYGESLATVSRGVKVVTRQEKKLPVVCKIDAKFF